MSTSDGHFGFGSPATPEQIAGWDIDAKPDGTGLPPGSGTVQQGEEIYARLGAKCHGAKGEGGEGVPPLVGGIGSLNTDAPLKTVGSYWPYATTLFDYTCLASQDLATCSALVCAHRDGAVRAPTVSL